MRRRPSTQERRNFARESLEVVTQAVYLAYNNSPFSEYRGRS